MTLSFVGKNDLMKKGLKHHQHGRYRVHDGPTLERMTWWRRDWNWATSKIVPAQPCHPLERMTWWRRDWNAKKPGWWGKNLRELERMTWWRRDWNNRKELYHDHWNCCKLERMTWWRRDWNQPNLDPLNPWNTLERMTWWRRDWNSANLRAFFVILLSRLERMTWWRRDWNNIKLGVIVSFPRVGKNDLMKKGLKQRKNTKSQLKG